MGKASRLRAERSRRPAGPYFHGGAPGLSVGDLLLPRDALPEWRGAAVGYAASQFDASAEPGQGEYVYVTRLVDVAASFAARFMDRIGGARPGDVYEVELIGKPSVDPDFATFPGVAARARRATIVSVVARAVALDEEQQMRTMGPYMLWTDGSPVYDVDGYFLPSPEARAQGVTAAQTRPLGRWRSFDALRKVLVAPASAGWR